MFARDNISILDWWLRTPYKTKAFSFCQKTLKIIISIVKSKKDWKLFFLHN